VSATGKVAEPSGFLARDWKKTARMVPSAIPSSEPTVPRIAPWSRKIRVTAGALVPVARRIPISLAFCTTDTASTDAMPRATARITNTWIMMLEALCERRPVMRSRFWAIHESATRPVRSWMRAATASAWKMSAPRISRVDTPPSRSKSVCAPRSEMKTSPSFRLRLP